MEITASHVLSQLFNGIQFGVLVALLATGLALMFGMLGIINFAHGALYMLGAYCVYGVGLAIADVTGSFWIALVAGFVLMGIVGFIIERGLLRWLYGQPHVYQVLLTFGLLLVVVELVTIGFGLRPVPLSPPLTGQLVNLGLFDYPVYWLIVMGIGLAVIFAVFYFIERSALGALIRASAEDPETASTLGVNTRTIYTLTVVLSIALCGIAGGLHAPMIGGLQPTIGHEILIICFVVVVLGGMGSIRGALLGGILIGLIRGLAGVFWAPASDFVMFAALGLVLLVRPQGLLGRRGAT